MSTKILDKSGLAYFWSKIKAWCNSLFALDSTVVHKTGNETISGTKTFSNTISGSIDGNAATASAVAWSGVTGKPTTIAGYGITDAKIANGTITLGSNSITPLTSHQTLPTLSRTISGSGNAITDITVSGHAITATKGASYITSSGSITGNAATATKTTATVAVNTTGELVRATMASNDVFRIAVGGASNAGWAEIATGDDYNEPIYVRQYQGNFATLKRTATLLDGSGNTSFPGIVTATGFSGPLTGDVNGNATTVSGTAGTSLLAWNTENTVYTVGGHDIKVKLPANPNTDTHWTSHLYAGASNGNANAATTNGNTYLIICDNSTARDRRLIKGTGATTVTSDANGVITINSTDNNTTYSNFVKSGSGAKAGLVPAPSTTAGTTKYLREDGTWQVPPDNNTVYTHPTTSGNKHIPSGGSSGQILRWSADGTAAWGADNNTTYSAATQSAAGLMSAADKKKLDGIEAGADNIPVGGIIYYAKKATPGNYLICNGAAVSRTTYATLFGVIGTTYGKGDGSTTFNVPNLINRFPQGNATPGTVHNAGLPDIVGQFYSIAAWDGYSLISATDTATNPNSFYDGSVLDYKKANVAASGTVGPTNRARDVYFSASRINSIYGGSSTVQPPALTLVPCIRYA